MAQIYLYPIKGGTQAELVASLQQELNRLQDQLNNPDNNGLNTMPGQISDAQHGDLDGGSLHAEATTSADGFMSAAQVVALNHFVGLTNSATLPTTAQLPNSGDFCFHTSSMGPTYYLGVNIGGSIKTVVMS